jgi:hypothetical protein
VRRVGAGLALMAVAVVMAVPTAHAAVTVGMLAPAPTTTCSGGPFDLVQESPNVDYVVPDGIASPVVTSWSTNAPPGEGQQLAFKVFEKVAQPEVFRQVTHDGPRPLAPGTVNTFSIDLPVHAGDFLGLGFPPGSQPSGCIFGSGPGTGNWVRNGFMNDGETSAAGEFLAEGGFLNVSAAIEPSHHFTIGSVKRHPKKGTATIVVTVPGPGSLALSGKGLRARQASGGGPLAAKTVLAAGTVTLRVKAKGRKRARLEEAGHVKLRASITYTPTGGSPETQEQKVKLRKS